MDAEEARRRSAKGLERMKIKELADVFAHIQEQCQFNACEIRHSFIDHFPETIASLQERGFKCERLDQNEWPSSTEYMISWGKKANHREAPTE